MLCLDEMLDSFHLCGDIAALYTHHLHRGGRCNGSQRLRTFLGPPYRHGDAAACVGDAHESEAFDVKASPRHSSSRRSSMPQWIPLAC